MGTSSQFLLGLTLPFLWSEMLILSDLFTGAFGVLLFICPRYLSLAFDILSSIGATLSLPLIASFLILHILEA